MTDEKMTLTVDEMSKILGVSRPMAYRLANSEGFPSIKVGRRILVLRKQLESWLEAHINGDVLAQ